MDSVATRLANLPSSGPLTLAFGEFVDNAGEIQEAIVRQLFWDAVARVAPEVISELMPTTEKPAFVTPEMIATWDRKQLGPLGITSESRVYEALRADVFVKWLGFFLEDEDLHRVTVLHGDIIAAFKALSPDPTFAFGRSDTDSDLWSSPFIVWLYSGDEDGDELTWDPLTEPRADAEKRLQTAINARLQRALDSIEAEFRERNVTTPSVKRRIEHFDWLVRYQVRCESISAIARDVGKQRTTVRDAVRSTADLLGFTLREAGAGGRPTKPGT